MPDADAADPNYGGDNNTMQDPEVAIQPQSPAPPVEPGSGTFGGTRGADGPEESQPREEAHPEDADEEPLPSFPEEWRDEFQGLLFVGRLTKSFTWMEHRFIIRTLTTEELFSVALLVKPYEGTQATGKAYQAAVCAAAVVSVDDRPLPGPIAMDEDGHALKFNYVARNWFPPTIEEVYNRYFELEVVTRKVIEAMGKASG